MRMRRGWRKRRETSSKLDSRILSNDVGERFLVKHDYRTEEDLFNGLAWCGKIVNMVRADGREQGDNLPRVVMVVMERVNHNILNMTNMVIKCLGSWKPGQKWKMLEEGAGGFRNITEDLSETHQRWDICGDDDVLNQLKQDMPLEVKLKPVTEDHLYYQKVTRRSFV